LRGVALAPVSTRQVLRLRFLTRRWSAQWAAV
jgi:hypothetical protein